MFKKILCLFLFMGIGFFLEAGNPSSPLKVKTKPKTTASAEKTLEQFNQGAFSLHPFGFMENKGQITGPDGLAFPEAKFEFQQGNTRIFLLNKGIAYQFTKTHYPNGYLELIKKKDGSKNKEELEKLQKQIRTETYRMNMCLQGANANAVIIKENQSSDVTNYYNLNALNVHYYAKITYKEIYPGIDWIIYTKNKEIKYDFVVRPGADPSLIKMQFDDQEDLKLNEDGSFTIKNALGEITEKTPISHQYEKEVATSFLLNKNILSFNLEKYDTGKDLIIDPALSWATYYSDPGFFAFTYGLSCCTDGAGNVYLSGQTLASSNIASSGHQNSNGGASDAFLVKFNSAGVRQWATFYGGTGDEDGYSCCIDASNNVYLAGSTTSGANIASGGHQNFLWAGIDAYLVKFNSSGVRQWATYYGGADTDYGYACCTDPSGNVYLAGTNGWSSSFLASGGHQNSQGGGGYTDAFLVKFNSSGARQWATYYGGNDTDEGRSCCSDPSGNVYLAGWSQATNNIASGGHQNSIGGFRDAYLVKFNGSGVRQWGTYYGGVNEDLGNACCTDPSGNVYLAGSATSSTSIASGGHQNTHGGGWYDAFLVKFNTSGVRQWGTYYGGAANNDKGNSCVTDASGNVYLCGIAESTTGIGSNGYQNTFGGAKDAFLVKFNTSGVRQWGTYFGSNGAEDGWSCASDGSEVYLAGSNLGSNNLAAAGHQTVSSGSDAFLAKFCDGPSQPSPISGNTLLCSVSAQNYSVTNNPLATSYTWILPPGWSGSSSTNAILTTPNASGIVTVIATGTCGFSRQTLSVTIDVTPTLSVNNGTICAGESYFISPSGAGSYTISGGSFNVSPLVSTNYTITANSVGGCYTASTVCSVVVNPSISVNISASNTVLCTGQTATLTGSGASTYTWSGGPSTAAYVVSPLSNTNYTLTGTSANGCTNTAVRSVSVNTTPTLVIIPSSTLLCSGQTATLTGSGASTYTWSGGPTNATYTVSPLSNSNYTLTGTSATGCTDTAVQSLSVNTSPVLTITPSSSVICSGQSATLTGSGANTYSWSGGPSTAAYTISPISTTNYTLNGTATNGCTTSAIQTVTVIPAPALTITPSSTVICSGNTATLTGSGASTYTWSGGPVSATYTVNPISNTNYTLFGTSASGCTNSAVRSISVNTTPTLTITPSSTLICSGQTATLTGSGANTYTWSGGPTTAAYAVSPLTTSNYTLTATASNACTNTAVQSVSVLTSPTLTITPSSTVICTGATATLTGSGASTYTWSAGPASAVYTVNPLSNSSYTLRGTAGNGCTNTAVQSLSVNLTPTISISPSATLLCSGKTATLVGSGASTYTWNGGPVSATNVVSPLTNTNYTLVAAAANTCTNSAVQSISVIVSPTVFITSSNSVICTGQSATLTGNGANTYTWSSGPNTDTFVVSPLINSDFALIGAAVNGCTAGALFSLFVNTTPTISIAPSGTIICSGQSASLTGSGASTYTWSGGPNSAAYVVSPVITTNYTLTGTAANACTNTAIQTISVLASPVLTLTPSTTVICSGNSATLNGIGANTYTWSGGPNTSTYLVNPNTTTNYTLEGTALNGCKALAVQMLSVNATPTLNITPSNTLFCIGNVLTLTAAGATTYTWSGGPTTSIYTVSPIANTNYTVMGTAPGNCTNTTNYSVSTNVPPTLSVSPSSTVICSGKTSTLTASGANTYTWAAGPATPDYVASPMVNTTFTVVGTAINGCTNFAVQSISVNASPNITITPSNSLVCSWTTATLTGSGANTYTWTGGPTSPAFTISPFSNTNYTLTGTAVNGCTNDAIQSISVTPSPTLTITPSSSVICSGNTATLSGSGALSYTWTGGPVNSTYFVSPSTTTTYILFGTAANSCTGSVVKTISVNATPVLTILPSSTLICQGSIATLTAQGAATFTWVGGATSSVWTVNPLSNSTYTVIGETNSCTNSAVQSISVNASPTLVIVPNNTIICSGNTVTLNASGATSYTWQGGPNTSTFAVSPSTTTNYTLSGTTSAGGNCSISTIVTVSVNTSPTLSVNSGSICSGNSFVILPTGASVYTISGGSATVSPMVNTNYTINGISAEGCPALNPAISQVTVYTTPTIGVNSGSICSGNSFTILPSGANTYTITGGLSVVSPSITASYSVSGTSALGCIANNIAICDVTVYITPTISANNGTICSGQSFTITPSGAATYSYSSGVNVVSPQTNTNYTVSGISTEGCIAGNSAVVSVSVNPSPTITVNSGNLCFGKTFTITPLGASTYTISGGSNTVSPLSTTSYSVTGTNLLGCISLSPAISSVSVIPTPTVTLNSGSVCAGALIVLQAQGANSYTWSTGANSTSISITPTVTTTFTVIGTALNTCTNSAISTITVPAPINASISPSSMFFCYGNSLTLTASGAPNYTWSNASQNNSIVVSPSVSTSYSLIASTGTGGCTNTAAYVVTVNPSPTVSISGTSLVCAGFSTTLSALGALSFTWNTGAMSQFVVVNPSVTSNYNVVGMNFEGCTDTAFYQLNTTSLTTPSICLVTVDSLSNYNEVYWDKSLFPQADTFIVYRETSASVYTPIAHIPKNAFSAYVDTNRSIGPITGNPNFSLHRYKLQYIDSCGNLSAMSPFHESVKITDNLTGNFSWNYYAIEGVGPLQTLNYVLTRRNVVSGITVTVAVAAGNQLSDPQYAALSATGNMKWFVYADGFSCNPGLKTSETSAVKNRTKSDNSNERQFPTGLEKQIELIKHFSIYPNPANDVLNIKAPGELEKVKLQITDLAGRRLFEDDFSGSIYILNAREMNNGIYLLTLSVNGKTAVHKKIIIQH